MQLIVDDTWRNGTGIGEIGLSHVFFQYSETQSKCQKCPEDYFRP